jgi:hypothetical protein
MQRLTGTAGGHRIHTIERTTQMSNDPDTDIRNITQECDAGSGLRRVILSLHSDAAKSLDDLLTVGRGRPRGQALTLTEAQLRRALRSGLKQVRG